MLQDTHVNTALKRHLVFWRACYRNSGAMIDTGTFGMCRTMENARHVCQTANTYS